MSRYPPDLHAVAAAVDRVLGASAETGERTHTVVRRDMPVQRLGLALEPWPGVDLWVRTERLDAILLHRPWRLPLQALPADLGVLASHAPFDEQLGLGWNPRLGEVLGIERLSPIGAAAPAPLGMVGRVAPVRWRVLLGRIEAIFGGIEDVLGGPADRDEPIACVAVARAMTADLVGEAARAGARAYLTGQLRAPARTAVLATRMSAVAVGHGRAERWSLGLLAQLLAAEWPALQIEFAPLAGGALPTAR